MSWVTAGSPWKLEHKRIVFILNVNGIYNQFFVKKYIYISYPREQTIIHSFAKCNIFFRTYLKEYLWHTITRLTALDVLSFLCYDLAEIRNHHLPTNRLSRRFRVKKLERYISNIYTEL